MATENKIGIRYAQALVSLAKERNELDAVFADMQSFTAAFNESEDLRTMLKSPVIRFDKKIAVLEILFGSHFSPLTKIFIEKIARGKREKYLGDIAKAYIYQVNSSNGIFTVKVKTASPLSAEHRARIQELAKKELSLAGNVKDVRFEEVVDPSLIGGFILTVGDRQIDTSFAQKLRELERSFSGNIYVKNF
jgi:F-type H+-transporting ATPase subunit delta